MPDHNHRRNRGQHPRATSILRIEDVKKAIRTNLNKIKNCNVLDENENEVWILDLVSTELGCDSSQPGGDLSEQIPDFLTARCAYRKIS